MIALAIIGCVCMVLGAAIAGRKIDQHQEAIERLRAEQLQMRDAILEHLENQKKLTDMIARLAAAGAEFERRVEAVEGAQSFYRSWGSN